LALIGAALRERPGDAPSASRGVPRRYRLRGEREPAAVADLFVARCSAYGAAVTTIAPEGIGTAVAAALERIGASRIAIPADLPPDWRMASVEWVGSEGKPGATLAAVDGALTGCAVAIAETGTIVLDAGRWQGPRALTLLPDYHLCVVRIEQIVELLPEALERIRSGVDAGRPVTFVSGCSATSDIELERVGGVHGPRTLEVLLVRST
jgi:L-lactate dehydrogenase complex protein LldG